MAIRRKGNTTPRIVHESWTLRPNGEKEKLIVWEGFHADLQSIGLQYQQQGYETDIDQRAGSWKQMRVTIPNAEDGNDAPVDIWEISTEYAQVDIRNNPNVIALATTYNPSNPQATLRSWVRLIKALLDDSDDALGSVPVEVGTTNFEAHFQELYNFYAAGGEAFEQARLVLRHRQMNPNIIFRPITLSATEKFYSKTQLISTFGVPSDVADVLPESGDTPPAGFTWGYRLRENNSTMNRGEGRREQNRDWVFAAWNTLAYTYVP